MFGKIFSSFLVGVAALFGGHGGAPAQMQNNQAPQGQEQIQGQEMMPQNGTSTNQNTPGRASMTGQANAASNMPSGLSDADLLKIAHAKPTTLPLGDSKYTTTGAKKGYIYLCNVRKDNPGSMVNGPWINGSTWTSDGKVSVSGTVSWPNATFSNTVSGNTRTLSGNDLPVGHTTGVFPVATDDPAAKYDPNPNTIKTQTLKDQLPANPSYYDTPNCMGMEVGVMLSGVPLFNGFDAGLRDAQAHEIQDSCEAHPQGNGEYHYHGLSSCFTDIGVSTVLGYALDGFPITGPKVAEGKYLSTDDLDICHGITSDVIIDGKKKTTYHYVLTYDFPYSASCFRGKPVSYQVIGGMMQSQKGSQQGKQGQGQANGQGGGRPGMMGIRGSQNQGNFGPGQMGQPPQEAISACSNQTSGASCSFTSPMGDTISGTCKSVSSGTVACVPAQPPQQGGQQF